MSIPQLPVAPGFTVRDGRAWPVDVSACIAEGRERISQEPSASEMALAEHTAHAIDLMLGGGYVA